MIYESGKNKNGYFFKRDRALEDKVRQICREEINIAIPLITAAIAKDVENGVLSAFSYDVQIIADTAANGIGQMIDTDRIGQFVSARISEEVSKRIKSANIKIR